MGCKAFGGIAERCAWLLKPADWAQSALRAQNGAPLPCSMPISIFTSPVVTSLACPSFWLSALMARCSRRGTHGWRMFSSPTRCLSFKLHATTALGTRAMSIHQQHSDDSRQQMIQRTECSEAWARRVGPDASMTDSLKNWATDFEERQMTFRQAAVWAAREQAFAHQMPRR